VFDRRPAVSVPRFKDVFFYIYKFRTTFHSAHNCKLLCRNVILEPSYGILKEIQLLNPYVFMVNKYDGTDARTVQHERMWELEDGGHLPEVEIEKKLHLG